MPPDSDNSRDATEVTLTYDWSAVPPEVRENFEFPPFEQRHLDNSLEHLTQLASAPTDAD